MARNDRTAAGPYWTRNWIEKMWRFTAENFVDFDTGSVDFEALGREEYEFRKALFYRKFKNSPRAKEAFEEAGEGYRTNVENGKKGGRPRKNISDGDAATREGAEDSKSSTSPSSDTLDSLTDKASDPVACNTANTDPDRGHDSGNPYDQAPSTSSTPTAISANNGPRQTPTAISANNGPRQAPSRGGSAATISGTPEALVNQTRDGAGSLRGVSCHSAPSRTSGPMPEERQVVIDFAVAEGLDVDDACECWYVTVNERDGKTADGKKINSWKAYVRKWCTTRKNNRRTA